jgi:Baculovirus P33
MDKIRTLPARQLAETQTEEVTYMYHIACLITYHDPQEKEIEQLRQWLLTLSPNMTLAQMKTHFEEKMEELNLRAVVPKNYSYTFTTIWDVIHFLCMLVDDMVDRRDELDLGVIVHQIKLIKAFLYNLFASLNCAMCRNHYMTTQGFNVVYLERIEIALNRDKHGDPLVLVDEPVVDTAESKGNVLFRHCALYATFQFHNHVNAYRWVQRDRPPPADMPSLSWSALTEALNLKKRATVSVLNKNENTHI